MGWLSVTSILLCDSEINEAGGERDVSRTRARKMGMAAWMDTIAGWMAGGPSRMHGNG
jgi:hypothetical protein